MPVNDVTTNRSYQKPNIANTLSDDVGRLRSALDAIDTDMASKAPTAGPTFTGVTTIAAGSAAAPSLTFTGATSDTGFYSPGADQVAISTGGSERIRIGSTGPVAIGSTITSGGGSGCSIRFANPLTGSTSPVSILGTPQVQVDATANPMVFSTAPTTAASAVINELRHYSATGVTLGSGSTLTNQYAYFAGSTHTAATNNYGFYSAIGAGAGRWNFYAAGTADSYFASNNFIFANGGTERARVDSSGRLLLGSSSTVSVPAWPGDLTLQYNTSLQTNGATVNASAIAATAWTNTINGAGTLSLAKSRSTTVGTYASGLASGDLVGNIVFSGDDSQKFVAGALISAAADRTPGLNSMPGRLVFSTTADGAASPTEHWRISSNGTFIYNQPAPAAVDTTATLTVANLTAKIITSTTAAAVTMTLPTGTDMDAGFSGLYNNMAFEWSVLNTGATNAVTVQGGTGHTVVGSGTVAASNSGRFLSRRTAATTWVTYRLSS